MVLENHVEASAGDVALLGLNRITTLMLLAVFRTLVTFQNMLPACSEGAGRSREPTSVSSSQATSNLESVARLYRVTKLLDIVERLLQLNLLSKSTVHCPVHVPKLSATPSVHQRIIY